MKQCSLVRRMLGFTLLELMVVIALIGAIIAIAAGGTADVSGRAKADGMKSSASAIHQAWMQVHARCGMTSTSIGTLGDAEDMIFTGAVNATYQDCYAKSGIPIFPSTKVGTEYRVNGYSVTLSVSGSSLSVNYEQVPDTLALILLQELTPSATALSATATTGTGFSYGAYDSATKRRTFTYVFSLN